MRSLATISAIVLLGATLLWGGCMSCPQFFMIGKSSKSCCDSDGKCRRAPAKPQADHDCAKMPFGHPEDAPGVDLPAATFENVWLLLANCTGRPVAAPRPVEHSPPDLLSLNSTLLI